MRRVARLALLLSPVLLLLQQQQAGTAARGETDELVVSRVRPIDPARGLYAHDGHRLSFENAALVRGELVLHGLGARERKVALGAGGFKHYTVDGVRRSSLAVRFEEAPLNLTWCREEADLVELDAHVYSPWLPVNAYHLVVDNMLPMFYDVLRASPRAGEAGLRRPAAPGAVDPEASRAVDEIMAAPRAVYEFRRVFERHHEVWARKRLAIHPLLDALLGGPPAGAWEEVAAPEAPRATCFRRLRWQPVVHMMSLYHDTWSRHLDGVAYAFSKWALRRHGLAVRREEPDPARPMVTIAARGCHGNGRCVRNREELAGVLRERHGAEVAVWDRWGDAAATLRQMAERTDVLVGAHGAGLVNAIFCRPGSVVAEIKANKGERSMIYRYLAHHMGSYYFEWDAWGGGTREEPERPAFRWRVAEVERRGRPSGVDMEPTRAELEVFADSLMAFWRRRHERKARFADMPRRHDARHWEHCGDSSTVECPPPPPRAAPTPRAERHWRTWAEAHGEL